MQFFSKRVAAAVLAFTSILSHDPNSSAMMNKGVNYICDEYNEINKLINEFASKYWKYWKENYSFDLSEEARRFMISPISKGVNYICDEDNEINKLINEFPSKYCKENYSFDLSEEARRFMISPISKIDTKGVSKEILCKCLKELCEKTGITKGIIDSEDAESSEGCNMGADQSIWEYLFVSNKSYVHSDMYESGDITEYDREVLAKCILIMYSNKNNEEWKDIITTSIINLSTHGGHCGWRVKGLIYSLYHSLAAFIYGMPCYNHGMDLVDRNFGIFKELMVSYLMQIICSYFNLHGIKEHLGFANIMVDQFKALIGMPVNSEKVYDISGDMIDYGKLAFRVMMNYEQLVDVSHKMIMALDFTEQKKIFDFMNKFKISLKEFCTYTRKSQEQIDNMIKEVNNSDNNMLKEWVKNETYLGIQDIVCNLVNICYLEGVEKCWGVAWVICFIVIGYLVPKQN